MLPISSSRVPELNITSQAYFAYKLARIYSTEAGPRYAATKATLTIFSVVALVMLLGTFVLTGLCMSNFGKGLREKSKFLDLVSHGFVLPFGMAEAELHGLMRQFQVTRSMEVARFCREVNSHISRATALGPTRRRICRPTPQPTRSTETCRGIRADRPASSMTRRIMAGERVAWAAGAKRE